MDARFKLGFYLTKWKTILTMTLSIFFALEPQAAYMFRSYIEGVRDDEEDETLSYSGTMVSGFAKLFCLFLHACVNYVRPYGV